MDLAEPELAQLAVLEKFLPAQLGEAEVEAIIAKIIEKPTPPVLPPWENHFDNCYEAFDLNNDLD